MVARELDPAHGGVVPEKTVAAGGVDERDRAFGVPMAELDDRALEIEAVVRVLPQTVEVLLRRGLEIHIDLERAARDRPVLAGAALRHRPDAKIQPVLLEQRVAVRGGIADHAIAVDHRPNRTVDQLDLGLAHPHLCVVGRRRGQQRPVQRRVDPQALTRAQTQRIAPVGLEPDELAVAFPDDAGALDPAREFAFAQKSHNLSPPVSGVCPISTCGARMRRRRYRCGSAPADRRTRSARASRTPGARGAPRHPPESGARAAGASRSTPPARFRDRAADRRVHPRRSRRDPQDASSMPDCA